MVPFIFIKIFLLTLKKIQKDSYKYKHKTSSKNDNKKKFYTKY